MHPSKRSSKNSSLSMGCTEIQQNLKIRKQRIRTIIAASLLRYAFTR